MEPTSATGHERESIDIVHKALASTGQKEPKMSLQDSSDTVDCTVEHILVATVTSTAQSMPSRAMTSSTLCNYPDRSRSSELVTPHSSWRAS